VLIRIRGIDPPGRSWSTDDGAGIAHPRIVVGLGRGAGVVDPVPGDTVDARWELEVRVVRGEDGRHDYRGPLINGRRGDRFVYLSWGDLGADGSADESFTMFRRAKVMLDAMPSDLVERAARDGLALQGTASLSGADGSPRCGRIPADELGWSLPS
jgi:hypothetical protein